MINLEKIGLPEMMDKRLKERLKEDISNFELSPRNQYERILVSINTLGRGHKNIYVLNTGYIPKFKFPEGSKNNIFESLGPRTRHPDDINIHISFNYNKREYKINGYI